MKKNYIVMPPWMEFGLVMAAIVTVMVVGYVWHHSLEEAKANHNPIGKYYNRTMSEKIDQDASVGILPMAFGQEGMKGDVGCSGKPNPPSDVDIWNYEHGQFTPRQGDIMIGSCYDTNIPPLENITISLTLENGTKIDVNISPNGTVLIG